MAEDLIIESKEFFEYYKKEIGKHAKKGDKAIQVSFQDIASFSHVLADQLLLKPEEMLSIFELALDEMGLISRAKVRLVELPKSQEVRIRREESKAKAEQQPKLMEARIAQEAAEFRREQKKLEGEGEKLYLEGLAEGQSAVVNVLGQDRTLLLEMLKITLEAAQENPEIIKVPVISVQGGNGSLDSAAAILGGASNFAELMKTVKKFEESDGDKKNSE